MKLQFIITLAAMLSAAGPYLMVAAAPTLDRAVLSVQGRQCSMPDCR